MFEKHGIPVKFLPKPIIKPDWLDELPEAVKHTELFLTVPKHSIEFSSMLNSFPICSTCKSFSDAAWHVTRLRVERRQAERLGMFQIEQNRGNAIFVTKEYRELLESIDVQGIGFWPAGALSN